MGRLESIMAKKIQNHKMGIQRRLLLLGGLAAATLSVTGCPALFAGGVAVGVMTAMDRRSSGAQVDDKTIAFRASQDIASALDGRGHVNVTCYNRQVLLTGEVPSETDRQKAEEVVSRIANVHHVVNALAIGPETSLSSRSSDTYLTSRVKTALTEVDGVSANDVKVVTERSVVYLMGLVTEREAQLASEKAASVAGVRHVVRVFEYMSEEELARFRASMEEPDTDVHSNSTRGG